MKRILPVTLSVLFLLMAALLIGPSFVDWNKYKPQIIEQAKSAAGYDVKIDGDIHLSLIPSPQLEIEGLSVVAPRGRADNLLTMKQANVSVNLFPLLSGNVQVDTVRLVNPDIQLEVLPDGQNSWMSDKLLADSDAKAVTADGQTGAKSAKGAQNISLDRLEITDGRISYVNRQTGGEQRIEGLNTTLRAGSLQGPFKAGGKLVYNGKQIEFDGETGKFGGGNKDKEIFGGKKKDIDVDVSFSLPESSADASFKGVVGMEPLDIQGKMDVKADNLAEALTFGDGKPSAALARKLSFSGLVTANENRVQSEDMDVTFGDAKGKGNLTIVNLKEQNPVSLQADLAFEGVLNFDTLVPSRSKGEQPSVEERVAKGQKLSAASGFLPETLSLPFPLEAKIRVSADGIQSGGKVFKGVVADISKSGSAVNINAKALDIPGKTRMEGKAALRYGSSSKSGEKGVTYADPTMTFTAQGSSEQLPTLLRAFAPEQDGNAALEIYKTAQFDLGGQVTRNTVSVKDSTVKLDNTTIALAASYKPNGAGGRPDVMVDLTTDMVDIDHIQSRLNGQKNTVVQKNPAAKADIKKVLEPVRSFEVPLNLTFDVSAQKAVLNQQNITGVRIKGKAAGQMLTLDVASAQNYMGAAASLKGRVANLKELSGVDLSFYGKTNDLKSLMQSFEMDATKVPASVSGAEATITAKGEANNLAFDANIAALSGQLKAAGQMTGLLDKPAFSNLTIGAKHPNLVKAIQIMNPSFSGGSGLEKPFEFNAKAVKSGDTYDLSGMKASLGTTTLNGDLKVTTGGSKSSVSGTITAGDIPLDSLLGAKTSSGGSGGSSSSGGASGEKWSRTTIETGWMHSMDMDMNLSAKSITYGGWNFTNPNTKITLKDGTLVVDNLKSGLFGGTAQLNAKVLDPADTKQPLAMAVQTNMDEVDLEPLVTAMSGTRRLKATGNVSLDMNVQSVGLSSHALVSGLQGKASLDGNNVVMKGFDLAQIGLAFVDSGKPLDRLGSLVGGATQSGETRFDTIKGNYDIMQGIATISSMVMDGPAANIVSKGNVNLPAWTIDTIHTLTFKQAKDAGAFDVAIKGSLSSPANTFGKGLFNDVLTRRLQQKAVEKLPDVLGKDLSGKLQNLGILPQKQQAPTPAPTVDPATETAPATDGAADPNAAAPQAQPAQQPAQQEEPKSLEDQIKEDPGAAMKNLLNSLGQ